MSRVANKIIDIPQGVTATVANQAVTVKGAKGSLSLPLRSGVSVEQKEKSLQVKFASELTRPQAGATRAHTVTATLSSYRMACAVLDRSPEPHPYTSFALRIHIHTLRVRPSQERLSDRRQRYQTEHAAIIEAIRAHDGVAAQNAVR